MTPFAAGVKNKTPGWPLRIDGERGSYADYAGSGVACRGSQHGGRGKVAEPQTVFWSLKFVQ